MSYFPSSKSLNDCKVDTGDAARIQSDRIFNEHNLLCPAWHGKDNVGRPVHEYTYKTKVEGCHHPHDRVLVENNLRSFHCNNSVLNCSHIHKDGAEYYEEPYGDPHPEAASGNFGYMQNIAHIRQTKCTSYDREEQAHLNEMNRRKQARRHRSSASHYQRLSGN
jgi:hypothetical protein